MEKVKVTITKPRKLALSAAGIIAAVALGAVSICGIRDSVSVEIERIHTTPVAGQLGARTK